MHLSAAATADSIRLLDRRRSSFAINAARLREGYAGHPRLHS
jgi:hypothetical protein